MGAHGTNIVLNNGTDAGQELPHLVINVLPRKENDSLNFEWSAKQATNEQLQGVKANLKVYSEAIYSGKDSLPKVKVMSETSSKNKEKKKDKKEDEDYLAKQLNRMP
jgi:diadenosine tetraphosphate (Ap4A) HIT family hydrolase